jgi:hypothetical protein
MNMVGNQKLQKCTYWIRHNCPPVCQSGRRTWQLKNVSRLSRNLTLRNVTETCRHIPTLIKIAQETLYMRTYMRFCIRVTRWGIPNYQRNDVGLPSRYSHLDSRQIPRQRKVHWLKITRRHQRQSQRSDSGVRANIRFNENLFNRYES